MRCNATFKILENIISYYEAVQVIGIVVVLVGACVPVHASLRLEERVAAGVFPVARHG